jgi:hypothetical protein
MPMGCADIRLRNNQAKDYISMRLATSNKGWQSRWFYLKNDTATALPEHALSEYTRRVVEAVLDSWGWGVPKRDVKRITDHLAAIKILREDGMKGNGIIGAYHARRVAPLMARTLSMHRMVPVTQLKETVLAKGPLANSEIAQCLKEAMDAPKDSMGATIEFVYPVPRHPPMRPEPGFIRFVSYSLSSPSFP